MSMYSAVPSSPRMFELVASSPTSLTATWLSPDPANGDITAYTVYCRTAQEQYYPEQQPTSNNAFTLRVTTDGNAATTEVTGLNAFTNYECYMTANTSVGEGNMTSMESARTEEDGRCMQVIPSMISYQLQIQDWLEGGQLGPSGALLHVCGLQ